MSNVLETLQKLEQELQDPLARKNPERLRELLHPDFEEVGRSGKTYYRDEIIAELSTELPGPPIGSESYRASEISEGSIILRYVSYQKEEGGALTHRCEGVSIWQLLDSGWRLRYHQGTPIQVCDGAA